MATQNDAIGNSNYMEKKFEVFVIILRKVMRKVVVEDTVFLNLDFCCW